MPQKSPRSWQKIKSPFSRFHIFWSKEPEERPFVDTLSDTVKTPSVLMEHVEALRKHLFRALVVTAAAVGVSLLFTNQLMAFLAKPVGGLSSLQAIQVTENIGVFMRVGLFTGIAIAVPYIVFEIYMFTAPGLSVRARRYGLLGIPFAALFFFLGIAFAYFFMLPTALPFLLNFSGIPAHPSATSYFGFITNLLFWIGVAFEFPLVIFVLSAMGLVKPGMLLSQWRLAIVIIAVVAAVITPTVDPINMSLVMAPMIVLYFFSIVLSSIAQTGRQKSKETQPEEVDQE